jgi:signal transduction histidine kinase
VNRSNDALFARARRRLTLLYVVIIAAVLAVFSGVFFVALAIVLQPEFDLAPDLPGEQAADVAYAAFIDRVGVALVVADLLVIAAVGLAAWLLAARTLRPIGLAHERQRRFVADASHEMRSPLAVIRSATDNALRTDTSPADLRIALLTVADSSDRLARLTSDLLVLAQSDDAALRPRDVPFDLSVVVAETLGPRLTATTPHLEVRLRLEGGLPSSGDPDEIGRIVDNLVDNALRYGGERVHVEVVTRGTDRSVVLEVTDDGPGIAAVDRERIFEPFHRVQPSAATPPGTGLGLAIAASLARRNAGRLTVDSEPGRGATFRLTLPRSG